MFLTSEVVNSHEHVEGRVEAARQVHAPRVPLDLHRGVGLGYHFELTLLEPPVRNREDQVPDPSLIRDVHGVGELLGQVPGPPRRSAGAADRDAQEHRVAGQGRVTAVARVQAQHEHADAQQGPYQPHLSGLRNHVEKVRRRRSVNCDASVCARVAVLGVEPGQLGSERSQLVHLHSLVPRSEPGGVVIPVQYFHLDGGRSPPAPRRQLHNQPVHRDELPVQSSAGNQTKLVLDSFPDQLEIRRVVPL